MSDFYITNREQKQRAHVAIDRAEPPIRVTVKKGGKRSTEQNAYLWGVVYETILEHNLREQGWTNNDLHEYLLGEHFGWEVIEGFGRKRMRPIRRSSGLNKAEFADYIGFIQQFAAELGIYVPDPEQT